MSGSGLFDFLIAIILLLATGFIFFLVIDRVAPDPVLNKIGKVAVGVILLVVFLFAIKGVIFGGGGVAHLDPKGFIYFCIGIIVILVVLFVIDLVLGWIAAQMGAAEPIVTAIKYIIFAIALIGMLVLADRTLLGGGFTNMLGNFGETSRISR